MHPQLRQSAPAFIAVLIIAGLVLTSPGLSLETGSTGGISRVTLPGDMVPARSAHMAAHLWSSSAYPVHFRQIGLASGLAWSVTLNGTDQTSTGSVILFSVTAGAYALVLGAPSGFGVARITGPNLPNQTAVTISGASTFYVRFAPLETVSFNATGLPEGAQWGIALSPSVPSGGPPVQRAQIRSGTPYRIGAGYDPAKGEIFLPTILSVFGKGFVQVISDSNLSTVTNISLPAPPNAVAYDPGDGSMLVAGGALGPGYVALINDSTDTITAQVSLGGGATSVAYDSGHHEIVVLNGTWTFGRVCSLTLISDSNKSVIATYPCPGGYASGVVYEPGMGVLVVGGGGVSLFNDTTNTVTLSQPVANLSAIAYDPHSNELFAAVNANCSLPGQVSILNGSTLAVVATVTVGICPQALAVDSANGTVFVANQNDTSVTVLSDLTHSVVANISLGLAGPLGGPRSVVYDSGRGEAFVVGSGNSVAVINATTYRASGSIPLTGYGATIAFVVPKGLWRFQVITKPSDYRPVPGHGALWVPAHNITRLITFKLVYQKVIFTRAGLPLGTHWGVSVAGPLNESLSTTGGRLVFSLVNGTYHFTVLNASFHSPPSNSSTTTRYPSPANGSFTVVAPSAPRVIRVNYTAATSALIILSGQSWVLQPNYYTFMGAFNLTSQASWQITGAFVATPGINAYILTWSQYQTWGAVGVPSSYSWTAGTNVTGATYNVVLPAGLYVFIWQNLGSSNSTVTVTTNVLATPV